MIVVIDYEAGNLYNVGNALKFLGAEYTLSGNPEVVKRASRVILPGVGSARAAMDSLNRLGLIPLLKNLTVPFLGICLGLQVLFERSEEENTGCLGVFPGVVRRFDSEKVKVPHIGWNQVTWETTGETSSLSGRLIEGLPNRGYFYFVHSFYAPLQNDFTIATAQYDKHFSAAVADQNYLGVQFHPERSGEQGLQLIQNFLNID